MIATDGYGDSHCCDCGKKIVTKRTLAEGIRRRDRILDVERKDAWIKGFIAAASLFSGHRVEYERARDEYLKSRVVP